MVDIESPAADPVAIEHPEFTEFTAQLKFDLDDFQRDSCYELEEGNGVLVCAPTGAGKTVVGEFAVHLALSKGTKCFYTTPIKALSNQKYAELVQRYGSHKVGLLTGDTSINSNADIVVMTTEVLRNMLYASSPAIAYLGYVVMDEVHYLADRFRGAVWEEVILHLPEDVRLVSLSATVSNAEEFGEWLQTVRGNTSIIVSEVRPVPLWQHMLVGGRLYDLFEHGTPIGGIGNVDKPLHLNNQLMRRSQEVNRMAGPGRGPGRKGGGPNTERFRPPSRAEVIRRLDEASLLPAIVFIFSRAGCTAAVEQTVRSGVNLTSPEEVEKIRAVIDKNTKNLPQGDLAVLGYWEWREALERGVTSHHAGMLPAFKETVEELFVRGLAKVVFATETLALGINMPARTVVLEKLVKYNGEAHVDLTPGEYTQLTGRAGRRGIDVEGHGVVLWQPGIDPQAVAGLASTRTYPLRSSFKPGYNMSINLVGQLGAARSRQLLEQSFAQFQADRSVVGVSRHINRNREALAGYKESMTCHLGDFEEYALLRRKVSDREKYLARQSKSDRRSEAAASLEDLRKGDIIAVPAGRRMGLAVVIDPGLSPVRDAQPLVITEDRWGGQLSALDFTQPVVSLGKLRLPKSIEWRSATIRRDIAARLRSSGVEATRTPKPKRETGEDAELATLRRALRAHPCHGCDDRESHARWGERYSRLVADTNQLESKVAATTHSLARSFDRIRSLLVARDYLGGPDAEDFTEHGRRLARLYSESDLLVAECLRAGIWKNLSPQELAAVVSAVVYEARRDGTYPPAVPAGMVTTALEETSAIWEDLAAEEQRNKIDPTKEPDNGFVWPMFRWARGESLEKVLLSAAEGGIELSAGDFVRWCRQVIDLLEQLRIVLGKGDPIGAAASAAVTSIKRGVVAMASL